MGAIRRLGHVQEGVLTHWEGAVTDDEAVADATIDIAGAANRNVLAEQDGADGGRRRSEARRRGVGGEGQELGLEAEQCGQERVVCLDVYGQVLFVALKYLS